jgi:hypothetical protein
MMSLMNLKEEVNKIELKKAEKAPDLIQDYDAIGFDLDNCLVKFKDEYFYFCLNAILT